LAKAQSDSVIKLRKSMEQDSLKIGKLLLPMIEFTMSTKHKLKENSPSRNSVEYLKTWTTKRRSSLSIYLSHTITGLFVIKEKL